MNYEISNWARPGAECRHNLLYWEQGEYIGFGCAAHSHRNATRWWNVRTIERYVSLIEEGRRPRGAAKISDATVAESKGPTGAAYARRSAAKTLAVDELPGLVDVMTVRRGSRVGPPPRNEVALRLR